MTEITLQDTRGILNIVEIRGKTSFNKKVIYIHKIKILLSGFEKKKKYFFSLPDFGRMTDHQFDPREMAYSSKGPIPLHKDQQQPQQTHFSHPRANMDANRPSESPKAPILPTIYNVPCNL